MITIASSKVSFNCGYLIQYTNYTPTKPDSDRDSNSNTKGKPAMSGNGYCPHASILGYPQKKLLQQVPLAFLNHLEIPNQVTGPRILFKVSIIIYNVHGRKCHVQSRFKAI
jgi:hypothetical protein